MTLRPQKTAMLLAQQIAADIERDGHRPGDRLPPEREMVVVYDVGRGTLREALRFLELQGVIALRPGPGGGPIVQEPDADSLALSLALLLQRSHAPLSAVLATRSSLLPVLAARAAERMTAADAATLSDHLDAMAGALADRSTFDAAYDAFLHALARGADNPVVAYLHDAVLGILTEASVSPRPFPADRADALADLRAVHAAVLQHAPDAAADAVRRHVDRADAAVTDTFGTTLAAATRWGQPGPARRRPLVAAR